MNGAVSDNVSRKLEKTSVKVKDPTQSDDKMVSASSLDISVVKFLESRGRELDAMRESASRVSTNARVMQQLPRHMRRRAASHNVKRLPRELRSAAEKEMQKSGGIRATSKRPSRRHRRRPRNLLQDYERRKRKHAWLETHIWHAKRFHMAEMWGYKVPLHPNDRGVRAAYRDSINKCLAFDLSYYCCIELSGPQELLLTGLSKLTSTEIGPSFGSQKYIRGTKEGQTVLYRENSYPFHALGDVKYLWKPQLESCDKESFRSLWIWTHPASFQLILDEIKKVFQGCHDATDDLEEGPSIGSIVIRSLKDRLNRFRLVGPKSQEVLKRVFVPAKMDEKVPDGSSTIPVRWQSLIKQDDDPNLFLRQASSWNQAEAYQSPNDFLPNSVYGLVVRDPRVAGRLKKEPTNENTLRQQQTERLESWVSASPIWDPTVRDSVKSTMMTTHEINDLKAKNLVPGSPLDIGARESRVPVLFLQNPGFSETVSFTGVTSKVGTAGYGCGWDIILPSGWSLPFWIALNHSEAHPAGLQELRHLSFERPELIFPDNYPDTCAGAEMNLSEYVKAKQKYAKIPPAKRINYVKLKVKAPFHYPWKELIAGWKKMIGTAGNADMECVTSEVDNFFCVRSKSLLQSLQMLMNKTYGQQNRTKGEVEREAAKREAALVALQRLSHMPCVVAVHLRLVGRGAPGQFSMICVPEEKDLLKYYESSGSPVQVHEDEIRKRTEILHEKEMIKSKKRNCSVNSGLDPPAKKQKVEVETIQHKTILCLNKQSKGNLSEPVAETSNEAIATVLEVLPVVGDVVKHCSRLNLGYVTSKSGVSFSKGCGSALGFVSLCGLLSVIENQKNQCEKIGSISDGQNVRSKLKGIVLKGIIVLVRSTRSEHYRFAKLNILQRDL